MLASTATHNASAAPGGCALPQEPGDDNNAGWLESMEAACFGGGLPTEVENEIRLAGLAWHNETDAEQHLQRAFELAPQHPATHIALYRFYFYRSRLQEALLVCLRWLIEAAPVNRLSDD